MKLKGKLIEFMIVHDLVPMRIRWGKSASGIGRMFNDVFHIVEENANEVKIHATKCMWKNKKEWTPEVCASINGDNFCELVLRKRDHFISKS